MIALGSKRIFLEVLVDNFDPSSTFFPELFSSICWIEINLFDYILVAFPGGHVDDTDKDLTDTALREVNWPFLFPRSTREADPSLISRLMKKWESSVKL